MKNESYKVSYIFNDEIYDINNSEGFEKLGDKCIYEVMRLMKGKPLFFEQHIERLKKSAQLSGYSLEKDLDYFKEMIEKLVEINDCQEINVKLYVSSENGVQSILGCFIKSYYPEKRIYNEGIKTIVVDVERENPNVKQMNVKFKEDIKRRLEENRAFEALIANHEGYITEGSRSNMFFVKDNMVYTSPAGDVLLGVTRNYILNVCKKLNLKIVQENISVDELDSIQGAFMTGTSVGVLPITCIDDYKYDSVNLDIIKAIAKEYNHEVENYINK